MLHTHSFTYYSRYIMFHSQCFSFPCQYHSTNVPYPFFHILLTLYNVSLPVLQFSPVSIIPPMLQTHLFTYRLYNVSLPVLHFPLSVTFHQFSIPIFSPTAYIMFLSQYFSFPCQYHSTNDPYPFIHLPPTLYNVSLPILQFPLSVPFHQCSIPIHSATTQAI